jgi:hypothetical protein
MMFVPHRKDTCEPPRPVTRMIIKSRIRWACDVACTAEIRIDWQISGRKSDETGDLMIEEVLGG